MAVLLLPASGPAEYPPLFPLVVWRIASINRIGKLLYSLSSLRRISVGELIGGGLRAGARRGDYSDVNGAGTRPGK